MERLSFHRNIRDSKTDEFSEKFQTAFYTPPFLELFENSSVLVTLPVPHVCHNKHQCHNRYHHYLHHCHNHPLTFVRDFENDMKQSLTKLSRHSSSWYDVYSGEKDNDTMRLMIQQHLNLISHLKDVCRFSLKVLKKTGDHIFSPSGATSSKKLLHCCTVIFLHRFI